MVCAACCHRALVFAVIHLYNNFYIFIASVHSFFSFLFYIYTFQQNLLLIIRRNGPRYQRVLALCAFFNRGGTEGTNSSKILCSMFVYALFYVSLCTGLFE